VLSAFVNSHAIFAKREKIFFSCRTQDAIESGAEIAY